MARIDAFLKLGTQQGCSDVHLAVGVPPMLRMHGDLMPIKFRDLRDAELEGYIAEILTRSQNQHFAKGHDLDFSYVSAEGGRFRVNVYRKETGVGATFRAIPSTVPTLESLALPPVVTKLCDFHQGMVLVTGSTGTGKSTTLAAMIDHLNSTRKLNIISLEDPIEFVHRSKQSQVIQRELGTLHTTGAVKTIDRVIDALPVEEREQTKSFLAQNLLAVVTQVLVKTADGHGRKAICEVLMMTKAIAKLIQTEQTHQIPSQLQMGRDLGMQLLDQALLAAISARTIDPDDAYSYATDKRPFQKFVTDTSMLPKADTAAPSPAPAAAAATGSSG